MSEAYIVAAQRTAGGRRGGLLRDWHPADLAGEELCAAEALSVLQLKLMRTFLAYLLSLTSGLPPKEIAAAPERRQVILVWC